jgi:AcrR family transcriptional regulator
MKTDARVRYTQRVLKGALLKLLAEKPINKITVKEVCELADVNRATFYAHYADCFALLANIENDLLEGFEASMQYLESFDVTKMVEAIYDMIDRNLTICKVLVFGNANSALVQRMIALAHDKSIAYWRTHLKKASEEELQLLFVCLSTGLMNVVIEGYPKYERSVLISFVNRTVQSSVAGYM